MIMLDHDGLQVYLCIYMPLQSMLGSPFCAAVLTMFLTRISCVVLVELRELNPRCFLSRWRSDRKEHRQLQSPRHGRRELSTETTAKTWLRWAHLARPIP